MRVPPGRPVGWRDGLDEVDRLEWRVGDPGSPGDLLGQFLDEHGLGGDIAGQRPCSTGIGLLLGAAGCAALAGLPVGPATPAPGVPDLVAVAVRPQGPGPPVSSVPDRSGPKGPCRLGAFRTSWSDEQHRSVIELVREAIARGDLYQANVVGHRHAAFSGDPLALAQAVARIQGATYGGVLTGAGWAVGCASPERLVRLAGGRLSTQPVKGTWSGGPEGAAALRASLKDRAEHVMIVDLARNDLAQLAVTGTVEVDELFALADWSGLWQAGSTVSAQLAPGRTVLDVLRAVAPGGSVTGAPKRAAWSALVELEPVGRGPSMGAFGFLWPGGLDLGLSIRTVALADDRVHVWAGGGITWGSDPDQEVLEAHAKAGPVLAALQSVAGAPAG
jgi:para-aminobenzoate synthetase component 1